MIQGVAVPTPVDKAPSPDELYPIPAVRSVALRSDAFYAYQDRLTAAGLLRACVVTTESLGADPDGWAGAMAELIDSVVPSYWIVGNEADAGYLIAHSHASDRMDPPDYARFWDAVVPQIRDRQVGVPVATFGFVSGSPEVMLDYERFCREADLVNAHPWSKTAAETSLLLASYRSVLGPQTRFMVGEWNRPASEIAEYVRMLQAERVEAAFYFSYHRFDVEALHDEHGQKTDRYYAFIEALRAPSPVLAKEVTTMTQAIEDRATAIGPEKLGNGGAKNGPPITLANGVVMQPYWNCVLVDLGEAGVYALAEATVAAELAKNS